jgi:hypothetical protein
MTPAEKTLRRLAKASARAAAGRPEGHGAEAEGADRPAGRTAKAEIEKLQAQADIAVQDRKTSAEIALADKKADLEAKLALLEFQMKQQGARVQGCELDHKMAAQQQLHQHKVTESQMGLVATAQSHDAKMEQGQQAHEAKIRPKRVTLDRVLSGCLRSRPDAD